MPPILSVFWRAYPNIRVVLLKRLNHVYARIKIRQTNTSMSVLVPTAIINEIEQNASLDIVVTPKYAPLKEIPEFILHSVRRSDAPDVP